MSLRDRVTCLVVCSVLMAGSLGGQPPARRRAVLVGINDYSASRLGRPKPAGREWPNLNGAATDVRAMAEMLVLLYGFEPRDIVTLTDQGATRDAMLRAVNEHLVKPAAKGDILLFYYAGHGSQVKNSLSDEPDKLDETLVPADSRVGARDIRDKELRPLFNRILDRGAALTVILDNCHSGSGARGLPTGARPRGVKADPRDVADPTPAGPRPEERGALVLAAAQDFDAAWEVRDEQGTFHGAFSWAWLRALRDASAGEPAGETFLRAAGRLRAETPYQEPVMAGNAAARLTPFLGVRTDRRAERTVIAVQKVLADGTVVLQGGWANGLNAGTELRVVTEGRGIVRLTVTAVHGLGRSEARVDQTRDRAVPPSIRSGALAEVAGWAALAGRPLRVLMPRIPQSASALVRLARSLAAEAAQRNVRWVSDPVDTTPTHLLRWRANAWELLDLGADVQRLSATANPSAAIAIVPRGAALFVQLPAPAGMVDGIAVGPGTERESIVPTTRAEEADYILVGRYSARRLEYAWVRPSVRNTDRRQTGLPLRTQWLPQDSNDQTFRNTAPQLRELVLRLRKIQAWHLLESPPGSRSPYRLALRRERNNDLVNDGAVIGDETYELILRADAASLPRRVPQRYVYVFAIDSFGKAVLLFPNGASVENRFPLAPSTGQTAPYPPAEIPLGVDGSFEVEPPYGVDSYFLLTTDEPLVNPAVLEWDGVRTRVPRTESPLEQLLLLVSDHTRTGTVVTPANWSLEKLICESVPPRAPYGSQKKIIPPT